MTAGGTYLVGERGPELLRMSGQNGTIVPNQALTAVNPTSQPSSHGMPGCGFRRSSARSRCVREALVRDRYDLEQKFGKAWHQHPDAQGELATFLKCSPVTRHSHSCLLIERGALGRETCGFL